MIAREGRDGRCGLWFYIGPNGAIDEVVGMIDRIRWLRVIMCYVWEWERGCRVMVLG